MLNFRYRNQTSAWPGFVDLFSNLVIILIFLLIVFVFLWTTTNVFNKSGTAKEMADLRQLNAEQAASIQQMSADTEEATDLLLRARDELVSLESDNQQLNSEITDINLSMKDLVGAYEKKLAETQQEIATLKTELEQRKASQEQMGAEMERLRMDEITKLQAALDAAEEKAAAQEIQYVEMSNRLNRALADKVAELNEMSQYQSEFYKSIKLALGDVSSLRTDGDRFIISSDILFKSGSYTLSDDGKKQLKVLADVIKDFESKIPTDINWIIRVDGHTDKKSVITGTRAYKNNTELSLLRATAVVNELANNGVSRRRLLPSGFGDTNPFTLGNTPADLQQNRRIELQLTNK
ncbi:MAG: OmpA family protein [Alphaproteobacteria bacterium]|nr:OmpA family protein [Alphaproteobacteria bacterium]